MRGLLLTMCALALVAAPAMAQEESWPEGSAMHTGGLEVKRRDAASAVLETLNGRLLTLVSEAKTQSPPLPPDGRLIKALEAQQTAWKRYVRDECELVGALSGSGGSWPSTYAVRCQANLAELRVRRARAAISCIEKMPPARRRLEQNRCLYQLATLAVPLSP